MIPSIPSEFAGFVRDTGVRAFDRLAEQAKDLDPPLRSFVRSWSRLSQADKNSLFEQLIDAARLPEAPPRTAAARQTRAVKRYDPDEVAATLPEKAERASRRKKSKKTSKKK